MTRIPINLIITISCLPFLISCDSSSRLYRHDNSNRIYSGRLDDATNASLRQFLTTRNNSTLNDTIIIKYDYNNQSCWESLDQKDEEYIQGFIIRHRKSVQQLQLTRPNVSVFDFREPGNNVNKIKKWDGAIIIDSSKELLNLLFKKRSMCGNSIVVMPDKRFVFVRSDPHSEAMDFTQDKILEYLTKK